MLRGASPGDRPAPPGAYATVTADRMIEWGRRLLDRIGFWLQTSASSDRELQTLMEEISEWLASSTELGSALVDGATPAATGEQIDELTAIARELRGFTSRFG